MRNKYEIHKGVERADFILKYTSQQIPTGMCFTNLPSPRTTKAPSTPTPTTPKPTTSSLRHSPQEMTYTRYPLLRYRSRGEEGHLGRLRGSVP